MMRIHDLPKSIIEKIKPYRYDRIIEKHERPERWASVIEYYNPEFIEIDEKSVLLPVDREHHKNITTPNIAFNSEPGDKRILAGGDLVQGILSEPQEGARETLRLSSGVPDLTTLAKGVWEIEGADEAALHSGSRLTRVVRAQETLYRLAVREMGYPEAEVARFLGITTVLPAPLSTAPARRSLASKMDRFKSRPWGTGRRPPRHPSP